MQKISDTHMEKAYIILAHKFPEQLYRLIKKLDDNESTFYVHIDKKKSIDDFKNLEDFGNKIEFIKREYSRWAEIGIVKAVLNGFKAIKDSNKKIERIILLSGQDYPIKSNQFINEFLKNSDHTIFMEHWACPNYKVWKNRGGLFRFDKYFFGEKPFRKFLARAINFIGIIFPVFKRKLPYNLKPYGGWQWWIIDMNAMDYILNFLKEHPRYLKYHKYSFVSDEIFFQTILMNSKDEKLLASIKNDDLRYIKWIYKSHPENLRKINLNDIIASNDLFARKFNVEVDAEILDLIDKNCLEETKPSYA